jgi:hypothetical protein
MANTLLNGQLNEALFNLDNNFKEWENIYLKEKEE